MPVNSLIQFRRGTAALWTSANPVLANGEPGYETDTGKEKRGDGTTAWTSLAYFAPGGTPFLTTSTWTSGALAVGVNAVDATAGNKTPSLPTPTRVGQLLSVEKTDSSANTVAISGTIRGASSSVTLYWQNESIVFEAESLTSWRPFAGHKTKSSLDANYAPAFVLTGADPTGATDSSTAFAALRDRLIASAVLDSSTGFYHIRGYGVIPAGNYLVTAAEALMTTAATAFRGYRLVGVGRDATKIRFQPTSAAALFKNNKQAINVGLADLTFEGVKSAGTAYATLFDSIGPLAQNMTVDRVNVRGDWVDGWRVEGDNTADNNSEFTFNHVAMNGTYTGSLFHCGAGSGTTFQDLMVNYDFLSCDLEPTSCDSIFALDYGGNVNHIGGSTIIVTSGTVYKMINGTHSDGATQLNVSGQRYELRTSSTKLITCNWKFGNVVFTACTTAAYVIPSTQIVATFYGSADAGPLVSFNSCRLTGKHEYQHDGNSWNTVSSAHYTDCAIPQQADVGSFIVNTDVGSTGKIGGRWQVDFDNCKGLVTYGANGGDHSFRVSANWQTRKNGDVTRRTRSIKSSAGQLPLSSGAGPAQTWLPLGAILTRVRVWVPARGSATATNWAFALTDGNSVVQAAIAPGSGGVAGGTQLGAGWVWDSGELFVPTTTDLARQLYLTATNVTSQSTSDLCLIDYLPGT